MSLIENKNLKSSRLFNTRTVQNYLLVWLDATIDEVTNNDNYNLITKLREVVNTVNTFTDIDECIDFITDIKAEKVFMISSDAFDQTTIPIIQDIPQVSSIYIFCEHDDRQEQRAEQSPKVKGVFTDLKLMYEALKKAVEECDQNTISMSFVDTSSDVTNKNLDQLDQSFMYTQILKEILLTINFEEKHFMEFITYCREQVVDNATELKKIDKLEKEYRRHTPIWWYTYHSLLYSMLNRALRTMEVDLIIKLGFFVRDLHEHINQLYFEQYTGHRDSDSFVVYRGQGLSQTDFDQLMQTKGGLLSFNSFLSTSLDRTVSLAFAESNQYNSDLTGVLFQITISTSSSSMPFANLHNVSHYQEEEEILFSMHSIFRIGQIEQIDGNNRLWQVDLILTSDNDPQLHTLTKHIREETYPNAEGWYRLSNLLIKLGQFDKAQQVCEIMLQQTSNDLEKGSICSMLAQIKHAQGEYAEAITFFEKQNEICGKLFPPTHSVSAASYNNIGLIYRSMGEYSKARSYHEKALEILQKTLPPNHPTLAMPYSNIGSLHQIMGEYSKALSYLEKALAISEKSLPPNHPDLALNYNNISSVYEKMGEYSKVLLFQKKSLAISEKSLPPNHPDLATLYGNIGAMYKIIGEYSKALSFQEKALEIYQKTFPPNHLHLATSYDNIGEVYESMGEYSKALSSHEKALEIYQKNLSPNHLDLATCCNNIGLLYSNIGELSKAMLFHEKALEINKNILPSNHPVLATSYNNIGLVYNNMGEYSKAISYFEKALEIKQNILSPNHPSLATSCNNLGMAYQMTGENLKALSCFEKALEMRQKTLPPDHPDLATSYSNIGSLYDNMGKYPEALAYYESALKIDQKTLPATHPDLATSYGFLGSMHEKMGEYSKAFSCYQRAVDIGQHLLPTNPTHLLVWTRYLENVKRKL